MQKLYILDMEEKFMFLAFMVLKKNLEEIFFISNFKELNKYII